KVQATEPEPATVTPIPVVEVPKPLNPRASAVADTPPSLLQAVNPAYTEAARRRGVEGAVRLAVEIDE
ncbi:MAG TPA: hypothetical protein DEH78_28305, partial [Solibacterales bacterium]|nr:hypothetical protein [Bryobacterales bacterium]